MESHEGNQSEYIELTPENASNLVELRLSIDANKTEEKLKREAEKFTTKEGYKAFLSKQGEVFTGYVQVILKEDHLHEGAPHIEGLEELAHLARIGVISELQGQGIGPGLLAKAEEWAKEHGRKGMWLGYLVSNEPALKLYARSGYKDVVEFMDPKKGQMRRIATKYF